MTDEEIEARITALVDHMGVLGRQIAEQREMVTELRAAVDRMASYLGVAHVLKDPRV